MYLIKIRTNKIHIIKGIEKNNKSVDAVLARKILYDYTCMGSQSTRETKYS